MSAMLLYSSVVEHWTADVEVLGANPPLFIMLHKNEQRHITLHSSLDTIGKKEMCCGSVATRGQ